ncbi:MAG: FadR/GntR family transcriptional regulator [Steroidobacter sp.]
MTTRSSGRNFTHSIVQELGVNIVTGVYSGKNPFPVEEELCRRFGASRTVLREAVKMLTAKGLLSARPRQGTWVQPESNWNLLDPDILRWMLERKYSSSLLVQFSEVRLAIEPQAAALASKSAGAEEKQAVRDAIERMRAAERGEDDPLESDIAFHVAVLRATRNPFYINLTELTATALRFSIRTTNRYKGVRLANVTDHKKVADAIIAGRPMVASDAMRKMIQEVLDLIHEHELPGTSRAKRA